MCEHEHLEAPSDFAQAACGLTGNLLMQVESQLELAKGLSHSLNNRLFLKREDLQPVCIP